jgi:glutaredoxin 2
MNKLYHYVHCPFCVRVRMASGFLEVPLESHVLSYDNEKTPLELTGVKMLPIAEINGSVLNESLDIIKLLDTENKLKSIEFDESKLAPLLSEIGSNVHSLAMPYWIWTPEFDQKSRQYFQQKKEKKRGPFSKLVHSQKTFIQGVNSTLQKIEAELCPFYQSKCLTIQDILIAAHLWGLFVVPEFQFSPKIYSYLMQVKDTCRFNYHEDFWRENNVKT